MPTPPLPSRDDDEHGAMPADCRVIECADRTVGAVRSTTSEDAAMNSDDREKVLRRFWAKVNKTDGCWLWTATSLASTRKGHGGGPYGQFRFMGRTTRAHRVAYELFVGQIPPGMTIDHVKARGCVSTLCVNPQHLEAVTPAENVMRGSSFSVKNMLKTECVRGHSLVGSGVRIESNGHRVCVACDAIRQAKRRAARKVGQS